MNLSEITATLREIRVSPVKSLGQNFLHDRNLIRWIIDRANLSENDYVVEIGPGLGALTELALKKSAKVLAIEKDARLAAFLREHISAKNLEVLHADALRFDVRGLFAQPGVKLLGNLPYYISSQVLMRFLDYPSPISLSVLMLQKEMATRLSASPSHKDYGALTVLVQRHYRVEYLRTIPATVFTPRPEVDSALVRLSPRDPMELPACDDEWFAEAVRRGFSQRRKQLGKLLRPEIPDWGTAADALGLDRKVRAEALSLEQWIALANYVRPIPDSHPPGTQEEQFPVVDERDRLLGAAARAKVHGNNLRHRAVHILVFNALGEVLLQKRSRRKDRHPLLWDSSAAGHVGAGEEYDLAASRELKEELGIDLALEKLVKLAASDRTGQEFIWLYRGEHNGPFRPERSEIDAIRFFPSGLVAQWIAARPGDFAPGFVECWNAYLEQAGT